MSWQQKTIGDFVDAGEADIQTGPFGTQLKASDYSHDGTPVINVRNVGFGDLRPEKLEFLPEAKVQALNVHVLQNQDIVFGRKGAVERHLFVQDAQVGWVQGSDCIRLRFTGDKIIPRFISFAFRRNSHQEWMIRQCGNKATMPSLNQDVIKRIPVYLPDAPLQEIIVSKLSAYDDLIENNRRRIELLEEAARLVYREWFVHFRFPGHEHVKIVDGLPEGWSRGALGDLADDVSYGFTASASEEDVGPKFLRITDIVSGPIVWPNVPYCNVPERRLPTFLLEPDDIVVARTGATTGWARRVGKSPKNAVFASYLVRFRFSDFDPLIAAIFMQSDAYKSYVKSHIGGAAQPNAGAKILAGATVPVAPRAVQEEFHDIVEPIFRQIDVLVEGNNQLGRSRDVLLPRLMDGRLEV